LYKSFLRSFVVLTIWVCKFWQKDFGAKAAYKMLVKWTQGFPDLRVNPKRGDYETLHLGTLSYPQRVDLAEER
jgi:hypothetical protein